MATLGRERDDYAEIFADDDFEATAELPTEKWIESYKHDDDELAEFMEHRFFSDLDLLSADEDLFDPRYAELQRR